MKIEEISALYGELRIRNMMALLHRRIEKVRPGVSISTIYRAFKIENYDEATPATKRIIQEGKKILKADDVRIGQQQLNSEA